MGKNSDFEKLLIEFNSGFKAGCQSKLASELKVSTQAISSWINGRTLPSAENIFKMSKLFNKPEEEIKKVFSETCETENVNFSGAVMKELELIKEKMKNFELEIELLKTKIKN